jgi:hypothetical protein
MGDLHTLWLKFQGRFFPRFMLIPIMRKRIISLENDIATLKIKIDELERIKALCIQNNLPEELKMVESSIIEVQAAITSCKTPKILLQTLLDRWTYKA